MCLYTRKRLPRVAKRDIVCLKILSKDFFGVYMTPYRGMRIQLNSKIEACPEKVDIIFNDYDCLDNTVYSVNGGVVHSVLLDEDKCKGRAYVKKAIIPKGTEYYLGCFGLEIASKELYVTDKEGSIEDLDIQFLEELLEEAPTCNGIRVGDYLMADDKFVHPSKNLSKAIGIVVGFHDKTPLIAALDRFRCSFGDEAIMNGTFADRDSAMQDFNGKEHTKKYVEYTNSNAPRHSYKAFSGCVAYEKSGIRNWYLPALGEMLQMLNNALYINIAHLISGLGYSVTTTKWYWTSSESNSFLAWNCYLYGGEVFCYNVCRDDVHSVVPFLAYKTQAESTGLIDKIKKLFT